MDFRWKSRRRCWVAVLRFDEIRLGNKDPQISSNWT